MCQTCCVAPEILFNAFVLEEHYSHLLHVICMCLFSFKLLYLITCSEFSYDPPNVWFGWQRYLYSFTYDIVTANH